MYVKNVKTTVAKVRETTTYSHNADIFQNEDIDRDTMQECF